MTVKDKAARLKSLIDKRKPWLEYAKEITTQILPTRGRYAYNHENIHRGMEFNEKALQYLENLASMFMSGITSPTRPWLRLQIEDEDMMDWSPAKTWLAEVERITELTLRKCGFYAVIHNAYRDIIGHGTACTAVYTDTRPGRVKLPAYASYQPGEYAADIDEYGSISVVYRHVWMNAINVYSRWKDRCSARVKDLIKDNPYKPVKIIHAVEPRAVRQMDKIDRLNKPYASYWWEEGEDVFLEESGFDMMPYQMARWNANGDEVYSTGLGWVALKQAKALNLLQYSATYGVNKAVNPPLLVPDNMYGVNTSPGGINYYQGSAQANQVHPLQPMANDLSAANLYMKVWQQDLKETFMNDLFIFLMNHPNATATEVLTRNEEKLLLLAPALERIHTEMLTPIMDNTLAILMETGIYPPAPKELEGMSIRPQFVGILAQAQLQHNTQAINTVVNLVATLSHLNPEVADKLDFDQAVDATSIIAGTPSRVVRTDDEVDEIRKQRQVRMQEEREAAMQSEALQEIKTVSEAGKNLAMAEAEVSRQ